MLDILTKLQLTLNPQEEALVLIGGLLIAIIIVALLINRSLDGLRYNRRVKRVKARRAKKDAERKSRMATTKLPLSSANKRLSGIGGRRTAHSLSTIDFK